MILDVWMIHLKYNIHTLSIHSRYLWWSLYLLITTVHNILNPCCLYLEGTVPQLISTQHVHRLRIVHCKCKIWYICFTINAILGLITVKYKFKHWCKINSYLIKLLKCVRPFLTFRFKPLDFKLQFTYFFTTLCFKNHLIKRMTHQWVTHVQHKSFLLKIPLCTMYCTSINRKGLPKVVINLHCLRSWTKCA